MLSRHEWKERLVSNHLLFRRAERNPPVIGPSLDSNGRIIGDLKAMETAYFMSVASEGQISFFNELRKVNRVAADEYMLTISGSIEKWKEDVRLLRIVIRYLKENADAMKRAERLLNEEEKIRVALKLPSTLQRHFPDFFKSIDLEGLDFKAQLAKIRNVRMRVHAEKNYLENYLHKLQRKMPFLFE